MGEQASKMTWPSRACDNDQLAPFYEEIAELTGSQKVLPMNSGAEAVESAIKSVRKWGYEVKGVPDGQAEIIVCADNFHGRTLGIVGFSTDPAARDHFGPFAPGFRIIPFGDARALEEAVTPNTVAFLVEPIQGEAGVIIPPSAYFAKVLEICTAHDVMLILDEVKTRPGRADACLTRALTATLAGSRRQLRSPATRSTGRWSGSELPRRRISRDGTQLRAGEPNSARARPSPAAGARIVRTIQTLSWALGVEREIFSSSSFMSADTSAKRGVLK